MTAEIQSIQKAYTHGGIFHTDDVFSTALLLLLRPDMKIERVLTVTDDMKREENAIIFDIGFGQFDHHQKDVAKDVKGFPYSAFGLLWEEFGRYYLQKQGFQKHIEEAFVAMRDQFAVKIDQGDNTGYMNVEGFYYNNDIKSFNTQWFETNEKTGNNRVGFDHAVNFAKEILYKTTRELFKSIEIVDEEKRIWEDACRRSKDGIVVLDIALPWQKMQTLYPFEALQIVICPNLRGGYSVISHDSKILKLTANPYYTFVHLSGYMGVTKTIEDAMSAAHLALGQQNK